MVRGAGQLLAALCVLWANGFIVSGGDDSKLHAYHAEGAPASARLG